MTTYLIRKPNGTSATEEPKVNMWYVGFSIEEEQERDGCIAQYVGNGEFYDDDAEDATDMRGYDFIAESHMGN